MSMNDFENAKTKRKTMSFLCMWNSYESKDSLLVRHKDLELEKASRWVMSQRCKQHYGFTLRGLLEEAKARRNSHSHAYRQLMISQELASSKRWQYEATRSCSSLNGRRTGNE